MLCYVWSIFVIYFTYDVYVFVCVHVFVFNVSKSLVLAALNILKVEEAGSKMFVLESIR